MIFENTRIKVGASAESFVPPCINLGWVLQNMAWSKIQQGFSLKYIPTEYWKICWVTCPPHTLTNLDQVFMTFKSIVEQCNICIFCSNKGNAYITSMPKALFILIWYIQISCTPQSSDLAKFDKQKNTTFFMSNVSFSF